MSNISSIYSSIAGFQVSVGSVTPTVRNINQLRTKVNSADAPIRLLLPVSPTTEASDFGFIALGKLANVTWKVTDLLLWKPVAQGSGIAECAEDLMTYTAAYMEAIRSNRVVASQAHITGANFKPGVYYWPDNESGVPYYGVAVVLNVEEILSS